MPDQIITDPRYWDCECKKHFIHKKSLRRCARCRAVSSEQPDSRVNEIKKHYHKETL